VQNKKILRHKILLLGSYAVGKTSLTRFFVEGTFSNEYLSTIGVNIKHKNISHEDYELNLLIWDIADIVTHQNIPDSYLRGTDGILLVYDVTRENTLDRIKAEQPGFFQKNPNLPTVVIGNKIDLLEGDIPETDAITDIYTSAKTGENVEQAFQLLIDKMINKTSSI